MTPLSDRLHAMQADLKAVEETLANLESERDMYKRMCVRLAEMVDRKQCTYADEYLLEQFAERPTG